MAQRIHVVLAAVTLLTATLSVTLAGRAGDQPLKGGACLIQARSFWELKTLNVGTQPVSGLRDHVIREDGTSTDSVIPVVQPGQTVVVAGTVVGVKPMVLMVMAAPDTDLSAISVDLATLAAGSTSSSALTNACNSAQFVSVMAKLDTEANLVTDVKLTGPGRTSP